MPDNPYLKLALIPGTFDVLANGELKTNVQARLVFVPNQAGLASLPDYDPGTFAATFGLGTLWQKKADGSWAEV